MIGLLNLILRKLQPDLDQQPRTSRYLLMGNMFGVLYGLPLLALGLVWLVSLTDWASLWDKWVWLIVILGAVIIFSRMRFYMMLDLRQGHRVGSDGDFVGVILWASLLVFGPSIIWLFLFWLLVECCIEYRQSINSVRRWDSLRSGVLNATALLLPSLLSLGVYQNLDGVLPIAGLSLGDLVPALSAVLIYAISYFLVWLPFVIYVVWVQRSKFGTDENRGLFWFTVATMELPFVSLPLGVLASGLYIVHGPVVLTIYFVGMTFIALLASQLSRSAAQSQRHTVQLMGLEQLGRDILAAPADARNLPGLLRKHLPDMFPCRQAVVWLAPETYLLRYPGGKDPYTPDVWPWIMEQETPIGFLRSDVLPWGNAPQQHAALLTTPIMDPITGEPIGGLFIELTVLPQAWDRKTIREYYPALQNLAAQIGTALKQAENYQENMRHQRVTQELRLAGEIQASFLPYRAPDIPGWDISASLMPARQTSGDFFDFFQMEDGRLGIIIADVADKGLGAALYMALGRTLLLTYAHQYPANPAAVLQATNQRMLSDARAQMFITAFYGVLEPENGRLIYCNAGHHPPLLIRDQENDRFQKLNPNGMALGIDENAAWVAISQGIEQNDTLLLYTDGVVEADNAAGEFYGMARLAESAKAVAARPSQWIIRAIREDVLKFQDGAAQSDDITLICIRRRA
jgi:serine phosphatase RsbU (regulator of sigma subunit)